MDSTISKRKRRLLFAGMFALIYLAPFIAVLDHLWNKYKKQPDVSLWHRYVHYASTLALAMRINVATLPKD